MSTNVVVFGFGAILILVAILGGGFELKEFKVPKVGWAPRLLAGAAGLIFVLWGAGMTSSGALEPQNVSASTKTGPVSTPERPAEFTIADHLGDWEQGRVSEQLTVTIDGKIMGQLTADSQNPQAMLTVTEPRAGRYSYTLDGTRVVNIGGSLYRFSGVGQGTINVQDGSRFDLAEGVSGQTWIISILEHSELEKTK